MTKSLLEVPGATLPFYTYEKDGFNFFEFDARECQSPEPMINTMRGLTLLKTSKDRVVGLYFHEPFPLYARIPLTIEHDAQELESGDFRITFKLQ